MAVVPTFIRPRGVHLGQRDRAYIRARLRRKLGKFAPLVQRVSVRVDDVNGPRGGVDRVCRTKVVLNGLPTVVFEMRSDSLEAAVQGALAGVERTVRRSVQRRRTTAIQGERGRVRHISG